MAEKDFSLKLKKILENDDYIQSIKLLAENEADLAGMTHLLSLLILPSISKKLESLEKEKKYEEAINKIDEILNIEGVNIIIKSFCLNYQGCLILEISKDNKKEAFDKFYSALELCPDDKRIVRNIENFFPLPKDSNELEIYINKVYKYKDKFSDEFLSFLGIYEMCISYDNKDFDKSYSLGIKYISKAYKIYENKKEAIDIITHVIIYSASEVYSNYVKDNDLIKAENIYNTLYNLLKDNDSKDKMNILFGIMSFMSNEFDLAFKQFELISDKNPGKKILKAFCYYEYIKANIKQDNTLDKCIEYINILKNLNIENEDLKKDIIYLDFLIFIRKSELEFEKNDFSSYDKIEKMLEKEIDIKKRYKLEELKKKLIKKKKDFYFKEKNYNEFLKENKNITNLISEIYQEESTEEIEKKNYDLALTKIEKAIELKPNNAEFINNKAYINTQKGQYDEAIKNIELAMTLEPKNKNYQNNKLEILDKKYNNNLNQKLNIKEKEYIEKNILENDNINIQQNTIDLSLKLTKKKIQEMGQELMGDIINNNILLIKDNNKENENLINEKKDEVEKIIVASKSSELILENIKNNNINILDKELKHKIEECLDIKEKDIQSNVLSTYAQIKNLDIKEMKKPLEIINHNLKYEINHQEIKKNIEVIQNFLEQEKSLDIDPETASNLLEIIPGNDFTKYSEEERENDEILDNKKSVIQYFKDKTKEGIAKQLKETLDEYSYDKNLQSQIKNQIEQYINIDDNILKHSQKLKKQTNDKIFSCIQSIAKSKQGLSTKNFETVGNILGKVQENSNLSEEYKSYVKDKIIDTINISLNQKKDIKIPDNLMDNLSKELINDSNDTKILNILNKVSDNQKLTLETQNNLINILVDKNIENQDVNNVDGQNYELTYQILNKDYNNLSESQQKVVNLEKNTIEINKEISEEKIVNSLDNISSIVKEGYSLNKHSEKSIINLLNKNKENEKYLEKSTKIINNMAINSINVSKEMSGLIVNKINEDEKKPKLSKKAFTELLACLVNIVDNCNVPQNCIEAFESCLKNFKKGEKKTELKLAITGLSILSKKHYSLNKEAINSCLDIIESNILDENSLNELSYIIEKLFNETEIDVNTFTKLLLILMKNPDLLDKLSICLFSCLKFKKQKEIEIIIENNLKNFEKMIINNLANDNIINILKKVDINFYSQKNQFIYEFYDFDSFYYEKTFKNANFKKCINFINKYGVINEKYLAILYRNINSIDVLNLLEKILEKNPQYLNQKIYDNMLKIRTESTLFKKVLNIIKKFSDKFLSKEIIELLCEKCQNNKKEIYEPIIEIIRIFYIKNKNNVSQISLKNKDIFEIEMKDENSEEYLTLLKKFVTSSTFIPERYFYKIFKIIKEENKLYNYGLEIFLIAINKNVIIPKEIIEKLLERKSNELDIKLIQSILTNKNYKKTYNKKLIKILEDNSKDINLKIINSLISLIEFSNLENSLKEFILNNLNSFYDSLSEYKNICFWVFQDNSFNKKLFDEIKKSKFKDNFKDFERFKKYEEKYNFFLKDEIFDDKIKELSENDNEKLNLLKTSIQNFENTVLKEQNEQKLKLLKLINFFISQKIKYNLTFNEILQCLNIYLTNDNYLQYHLKFENATENYFNILHRNWIKLKILNKNLKYSTDLINKIIDNFFIYNFEDFLIEKTINLSLFSSIENINTLFDFLKDNQLYLEDIKNVINTLNKDDSLEILINKSILSFSNKKISESSINSQFKEYYLLLVECLIKIKWKFSQIDELLTNEIKFDIKMEDFKKILIPIIEDNVIAYNSMNNKNENLIKILSHYESKYWEYLIKELSQKQNYGGVGEYSLDELFLVLKEKNKDFSDELSQKLKTIILKCRAIYNEKIEDDNNLPNYPIKNYTKEDIQKWSKSKRTKSLINSEEFLPEILEIINKANELEEHHNIRNVQLISVLLILLSPKNRGVFAQIKTGEGKSTIVSVIAVIKALQKTYVDILSSSIVLAQRDKNEKKMFYDYFNLTVGSNDDKDDEEIPLYQKNIVYGDTLMFEGDILSLEFSKNPNSKRAKNPKRGFRCIIIDEVDSMCIDNLGSSTRLSNSFPSYEYLKILYPLIYNNLNLIDEHMDKGHYGKFKDENDRQEIVVDNLIKVTNHLITENNKNKENKFLLPKNLEKFINNQISHWCKSAYHAKHYYKENFHYVIGKDLLDESIKNIIIKNGFVPEEYYKIGTVDFSNTGVVSLNMTWSDGLTQFLQIKHGLRIKSEDLSTTFISHYSFFKRYFNSNENNIFGVTGTIGSNNSRILLKDLFKVNIFIIPPFTPSKLILLNDKAEFKNKEEWQKEILNSIEINAKTLSRTVLIICFTIQETNELYELLINNGYNKDKIDKYQRNDDKTNKLKAFYDKGDIIIATNLAGRGTDIKLSEEVKKNGGLHVIITFLPSNLRVEEQAIGRSARSGDKGSSIVIVNDTRKIEIIKLIRDCREEDRMEYIRTKTINKIKLKDELFNRFSLFYHELQTKWIGKDDLSTLNPLQYILIKEKYSNEFSILNDLEERWGIWLKKMRIDELDNNNSEKKINEEYQIFEDSLKKIYSEKKVNDIQLLNPLNYFCAERFTLASQEDSELCFFSNYLNDMNSIKNKTTDISDKICNNLDKTISSLKNDLCSQIQTITILANTIKNNNLFVETKKKELSEDAENKLKVVENLVNKLQENKSVIEQYLEKKKGKLIPKKCELTKFTKNLSIKNYFEDIGIPYFYEMTLEKEKNWFGMISVIIIGTVEIALGVILTHYMHNDFGLIQEGITDIEYGVNCILGKEEFDWKKLGKKKLSFAINLAINTALSYIRGNLNLQFPFKKTERSIRKTFDIVKEKVQGNLVKIGVNAGFQLSMKIFGEDFIIQIVAKFKDYSKKLTITYFKSQIQDKINNIYGKQFEQMLTIEVVSGNNDWTRILTQQLKICCKTLSKLTSKIANHLIKLIEMIIKDKGDWKNILEKVFIDCKGDTFDIFRGSLSDCLEAFTLGFLNIFKKFAEKKLPENVKNGLLTFNDILDKALDIGDALQSQNLMEILVGNNIINKEGIINGKLIFGDSYDKIKLNPIPIIIDEFKTSVIEKALKANNLVDYINKSVENIANEIEEFIKTKIEEEINNLEDLINSKMKDINNFIDDKFNKYVISSIDKLEENANKGLNKIEDIIDKIKEEINNKSKEFDDYSSKLEENYNQKIAKVEEKITEIKNFVNSKIKLFEDIVDKQIDEKIIKIKGHISNFEEKVYTRINEFKNKLQNEYQQILLDLLKNLAEGTGLNEKTETIKAKIIEISSNLGEKIEEFKKLINEVKTFIDEKVEDFNKIWNKIKNSEHFEKVKNTISKIKSILDDEIIQKIFSLINIAKNKLNETISFIKNIISKIIEKLNNLKEKLKDSKDSIPKKKEIIKKELNELKEELKKKINEIKEYIINQIKIVKDKIIKKISDFIKEIKSNLKGYVDLLKELIEKIEQLIKEKLDTIEEKLKFNIIDDLLNEISKNANNIFNINITETFKEKINNADKLLSSKIHNALDDIDFKEFKDKKAKIIDTLKDYQKKIDDYDFDAKKNETFQIIENGLVNALIDVIVEAISTTEIGNFLKGKIDEYKNLIEEASKYVEENINEKETKNKK